jgi:hypothetical protein
MYNQFSSHVSIVELESVPTFTESTDVFSFRADRPKHFHWLQKLCLTTLKWLRAYDQTKGVKIVRHNIGPNGSTFIDRLFKQYENVYDIIDIRPTRIIIGAKDFAELMNSTLSNQYFNFMAEYKYVDKGNGDPLHRPHYLQPYTILNMQVEVIPWMEGCVILP